MIGYARSIAQPARFPDVEAQAGGRATSGRVVAVAPEGPAARAGVRVGNEIRGCGPARGRPPRLGKGVVTQYRSGMACIASGAEVAELEVGRDGEEMRVEVAPRLIEGGVRTAYRARGEELDGFFVHQLEPQLASRK